MKVLFVADYLKGSESELGGGEIYDNRLIKLLRERGHNVKILSGKSPKSGIKKLFKETIRTYSFKWKGEIKKEIGYFEPDIIFAHSILRQITPSFASVAKEKDIPLVHKIGNIGDFRYIGHLDATFRLNSILNLIRSPLKKFLYRRMIKRYVDLIIAPSNSTKEVLRKNLGIESERIEVIQNPVFFPIQDKVKEKENVILFVGAVRDFKGVEILIKAFKKISDQFPDHKLKIVGNGEIEKYKELCKEKGVLDKVEFEGYVLHEELRSIYENSKVLVLPSTIKENSPLTPAEAISQGTPVITTDFGGQKELVKNGETGLLVEPGDVNDLAQKLTKILKNKDLRKKMSRNCLDFAENFSKEKHIKEIEEVLKSLIK